MKKENKKGLSAIITIMLIVVLTFAAAFILYTTIKRLASEDFAREVSCFDVLAVSPSFFISDSCYLNEDEILVGVERKSDALDVSSIKFAFHSDEEITRWQIKGKKCSDIREYNTEYGGYCEVPEQDTETRYVFNVSDLDSKDKVSLVINYQEQGDSRSCIIDTKDVNSVC